MKNNKDASIRVRIDSDVEARLKKLCELDGVNPSSLIRRLVDLYIFSHPETKAKIDVLIEIKNLPKENVHAWYVFLIDAELQTENVDYDLVSNEIPFLLPEFFEGEREPFRVDSFYYHRMSLPNCIGRKGRFIGAKIEGGKWKGAIYVYKDELLNTPWVYEEMVKEALIEKIKDGVTQYIRNQVSIDFYEELTKDMLTSKNDFERY